MNNSSQEVEQTLEQFWADIALHYIDWLKSWDTVLKGSLIKGDVQWFTGAKLNVSANCLDRHLPSKANHPAIIWEGDNADEQRMLSFADLHQEVCLMANVLKKLGIGRGNTVGIYLPMIPEAAIAMLACTRIGAIHTVVFAGFSAAALRQRLQAANCKLLITADSYQRGGKTFALKQQTDEAIKGFALQTLVISHQEITVPFDTNRDHWWHELRHDSVATSL